MVPDVPLEETEILRKEAAKNNIELVCFLVYIPALFLDFVNKFKLFIHTFGCNCNTSDLLV